MKVYIVSEYYPYEGGEVLAVYASREEADAYVALLESKNSHAEYTSHEWEVK